MNDPIAALLGDFDGAVDPRPAFAQELRAQLLGELERPRRRMIGRRRARVVLIVVALILLVTGLATATYLLVRTHAAVEPKPGPSPSSRARGTDCAGRRDPAGGPHAGRLALSETGLLR